MIRSRFRPTQTIRAYGSLKPAAGLVAQVIATCKGWCRYQAAGFTGSDIEGCRPVSDNRGCVRVKTN
jgi:hypothetical protein